MTTASPTSERRSQGAAAWSVKNVPFAVGVDRRVPVLLGDFFDRPRGESGRRRADHHVESAEPLRGARDQLAGLLRPSQVAVAATRGQHPVPLLLEARWRSPAQRGRFRRSRGQRAGIRPWGNDKLPPEPQERRHRTTMATLAFNHEEIAARELRPELYDMDGISRASVDAHYKLYQGYVNKRNEILGKLAEVDLATANQVYSEIREPQGRSDLRDRRRQEPRDLLRAPRRRRRRPGWADR